jgi:hypothetical protein
LYKVNIGVRGNDKKTRGKKNMALVDPFATPKLDVKSCSKESLQERGKKNHDFNYEITYACFHPDHVLKKFTM